ncbi:helix-turn-helix domain-containing protein [Campylobacter coli]|uniref:helix-turn-helix domain-containing protein n=1 Tax=Campylobacter coli TaxID=195 RepID=UPI001D0DC5EC|nr:helix-turn-helix domain-containing protein [Campylobacter coli]MCC3010666.1 helix-turn-helix domain-containing protein [Campylobacter jejuni]MCC2563365.1 helix-turn-helix domain-containing protein [Campylobacter coli]MCC2569589.1 helix-turn-helix domain-containing protein [Campylobacter coli]MCC2573721.1 helix-turn-helix domain-containing protein [Campylobacter coli]MCC2578715.1 helix-turn-helix domain-containing protein [Campylobacter coli]
MLNWKKIEDLNLKEVAARTKIELDFLEALVKKDFATLNRFNVRGFVKILSREYELDFTDFNEEFETYLNENNLNDTTTKPKMITPKLDVYSQKSTSFVSFIIIVIIIALIGFGIYYFDYIKSFFQKDQNNSSAAVVDIIGKAQSNLKALENNVVVIDNQAEENETEANLTQIQNTELNNTKEEIKQISTTLNNTNANEENLSTNDSLATTNQEVAEVSKALNKEAHFKASGKIWIGLIDLSNYRKTGLVKENDFNLSLEVNRLVLTGAAALSVFDENGKEQKFPAGNSKRFLIKDGKITSISAAEFMKLNKGKEW